MFQHVIEMYSSSEPPLLKLGETRLDVFVVHEDFGWQAMSNWEYTTPLGMIELSPSSVGTMPIMLFQTQKSLDRYLSETMRFPRERYAQFLVGFARQMPGQNRVFTLAEASELLGVCISGNLAHEQMESWRSALVSKEAVAKLQTILAAPVFSHPIMDAASSRFWAMHRYGLASSMMDPDRIRRRGFRVQARVADLIAIEFDDLPREARGWDFGVYMPDEPSSALCRLIPGRFEGSLLKMRDHLVDFGVQPGERSEGWLVVAEDADLHSPAREQNKRWNGAGAVSFPRRSLPMDVSFATLS